MIDWTVLLLTMYCISSNKVYSALQQEQQCHSDLGIYDNNNDINNNQLSIQWIPFNDTHLTWLEVEGVGEIFFDILSAGKSVNRQNGSVIFTANK